ncbi:enoyl-CoA hydratase family protein [soil metagenome]
MSELLRYAAADGVATITLDSASNRNALSRDLVKDLGEALARAEADGQVKVVLIRAAGAVFCSGADPAEAWAGDLVDGPRAIVALQRAIVAHPKPVVVKVQGAVRAGGTGIVAAADIAVAAEGATFALTEVKLGLAAAVVSLTVLPRMTDRSAAYTFLSGQSFTGAQAQTMGLVTKAVPADDLDTVTEAALAELVSGSQQGLAETKKLLNAGLLADIDARGEELSQLSARLLGSEIAQEAMAAFWSPKK